MDTDKNRHSKIIRSLCKEILIPMGVFQKGNSRIYFDDNGYYLTMLEFQPSSWDRGSYLNVGVYFLWNTYDYFSFDAYTGISDRVGRFVPYKSDEQFEKEMRNMVMMAKEQVLYYRGADHVKKAVEERDSKAHRFLYLAYHGQIEAARSEYSLLMKHPNFARISENWALPKTADGLTQEFVLERIKSRRKSLHDTPGTRRLPWNEWFDDDVG